MCIFAIPAGSLVCLGNPTGGKHPPLIAVDHAANAIALAVESARVIKLLPAVTLAFSDVTRTTAIAVNL